MNTLLQAFSIASGFPGEIFVLVFGLSLVVIRSSVALRRLLARSAFFLVASFFLFRLTGSMMKTGLAVPRPCWNPDYPSLILCPESFSFPSGHALGSGMIAIILGLILRKKVVWVTGISLSLLIAASRVGLGVHAPLDVMGGLALGYTFGWISWRIFWYE